MGLVENRDFARTRDVERASSDGSLVPSLLEAGVARSVAPGGLSDSGARCGDRPEGVSAEPDLDRPSEGKTALRRGGAGSRSRRRRVRREAADDRVVREPVARAGDVGGHVRAVASRTRVRVAHEGHLLKRPAVTRSDEYAPRGCAAVFSRWILGVAVDVVAKHRLLAGDRQEGREVRRLDERLRVRGCALGRRIGESADEHVREHAGQQSEEHEQHPPRVPDRLHACSFVVEKDNEQV